MDAVPNELSCLDLLLEWNSAENEGKGQTHVIVDLRLRQLEHPELASWLSHDVYETLENQMTTEARQLLKTASTSETNITTER